ncbi:MAG: acyl-CoA dehydrogenase family protein [Pseudomonadota bacterium]|nr:acyl-CoA dehydrogenase family protein [Pseudomonadota bacterium]
MPLETPTASWMSEEHRLYADSIRRFLTDEYMPHLKRWNDQGFVDADFWEKAGEAGILGASIPTSHGGSGADATFDAITTYEQARLGDFSWGYSIHTIVVQYVIAYATEEQKHRWLPRLAAGTLVPALAMTEPGQGSDLQSVETYAVSDGDGLRINGAKTFITNGQTANLVCLVVKTEKEAGARGVSLVMVETDAVEGFRRGRNLEKVGLKGQDTSELFFDEMRVPRANLLGLEEGQGFYQLMNQLPWERLVIGIGALGHMDFALDQTLAYVKERQAFGRAVFDFQNTRFKLAEQKTKAEVTRAFVNHCIELLRDGQLDATTASMAKWWGSQMQCEVIDECLQLFGGYGYMLEYPIARAWADARVQKIYGGTNEIMKELIARSL